MGVLVGGMILTNIPGGWFDSLWLISIFNYMLLDTIQYRICIQVEWYKIYRNCMDIVMMVEVFRDRAVEQ
jgi:hypothetical protein